MCPQKNRATWRLQGAARLREALHLQVSQASAAAKEAVEGAGPAGIASLPFLSPLPDLVLEHACQLPIQNTITVD